MTASIIIAGLAALMGSTTATGLGWFAYALWRKLEDRNDRLSSISLIAQAAKTSNATLLIERDDLKSTIVRLNGIIDDQGKRLALAEARAVHGLSTDELLAAVNGVPANGDGARAVPGPDTAPAAGIVPAVQAAVAPAKPPRSVRK